MIDRLTRKAIALVIKDNDGKILIVQRPPNTLDPLAGLWGFPAIIRNENESEEAAARRIGKDKLGILVTVGNKIGQKIADRGDYILDLTDYDGIIQSGVIKVPQNDVSITQYSNYQFTSDPKVLFPIATKGSLCTQIYLESIGLSWD